MLCLESWNEDWRILKFSYHDSLYSCQLVIQESVLLQFDISSTNGIAFFGCAPALDVSSRVAHPAYDQDI